MLRLGNPEVHSPVKLQDSIRDSLVLPFSKS